VAKYNFEAAVGFLPQVAEGTYNATLDAIAGTWSYTDGLLYGSAGEGVRESGISVSFERNFSDKAYIGASYTRALSDFLSSGLGTFDVVFPFVGNRNAPGGAPADGDATPIAGLDALLIGCGMTGAAWGSGVGWRYVFGSSLPISALLYVSGMRWELLDCRVALSVDFTPGEIAKATASIFVGSVKDASAAALPTLTYGPQASVTAPKIESVGNQWGATRGFSEATLEIDQTFDDFPDSNAISGLVKEQADRQVKFSGTLFADDGDKAYEWSQLVETNQANLDPLSFEYGTPMVTAVPADAVRVTVPEPELQKYDPDALGSKAGHAIELVGRGTVGNDELEIIFL